MYRAMASGELPRGPGVKPAGAGGATPPSSYAGVLRLDATPTYLGLPSSPFSFLYGTHCVLVLTFLAGKAQESCYADRRDN
jgi:hypothetical protein